MFPPEYTYQKKVAKEEEEAAGARLRFSVAAIAAGVKEAGRSWPARPCPEFTAAAVYTHGFTLFFPVPRTELHFGFCFMVECSAGLFIGRDAAYQTRVSSFFSLPTFTV